MQMNSNLGNMKDSSEFSTLCWLCHRDTSTSCVYTRALGTVPFGTAIRTLGSTEGTVPV